MRIREVLSEDSGEVPTKSNLVMALEFLRNRYHNMKIKGSPSVEAIVNMMHNTGEEAFGVEDLKRSIDSDPAIQSIVSKMSDDKTTVDFVPYGDETNLTPEEQPDEQGQGDGGNAKDPQKTVAAMAKRAANKRT